MINTRTLRATNLIYISFLLVMISVVVYGFLMVVRFVMLLVVIIAALITMVPIAFLSAKGTCLWLIIIIAQLLAIDLAKQATHLWMLFQAVLKVCAAAESVVLVFRGNIHHTGRVLSMLGEEAQPKC